MIQYLWWRKWPTLEHCHSELRSEARGREETLNTKYGWESQWGVRYSLCDGFIWCDVTIRDTVTRLVTTCDTLHTKLCHWVGELTSARSWQKYPMHFRLDIKVHTRLGMAGDTSIKCETFAELKSGNKMMAYIIGGYCVDDLTLNVVWNQYLMISMT